MPVSGHVGGGGGDVWSPPVTVSTARWITAGAWPVSASAMPPTATSANAPATMTTILPRRVSAKVGTSWMRG